MDDENFVIAYAAHTAVCTFLLDAEGVCRCIVMAPDKNRKGTVGTARCIGAQYVASLDATAPGGILEAPQVGTAMLLAKTDENGRISLIKTGSVLRFERLDPSEDLTAVDPYSDPTDRTVPMHAIRQESGIELSASGRRAAGVMMPARSSVPPPGPTTLREPTIIVEDEDSYGNAKKPSPTDTVKTPRVASRQRR